MHLCTRTYLTVLLSALALLAAACAGTETETATPAATAPADTDASYNDADITFLQGMVPHHQQAVEMSQLVPDRTDRTELQDLADEIIAAQEAEIAQMEQFLADAGEEPDADHMGGDMGGDMGGMSGMMTDEEMSRLADIEGTEFDLMFIDMMTEHHEGAIESAREVIADGENPEVRQLAEQIIDEQEREIAQMATWREEWAAETG
jgi:uncharacterized protein (DUF305 family)